MLCDHHHPLHQLLEVILRPDRQRFGMSDETFDVEARAGDIQAADPPCQQGLQCPGYERLIQRPMAALARRLGQMIEMQRDATTHVPLQIEPIAALDALLLLAKEHRMHLAGEQIGQAKTFHVTRIGLKQLLLLGAESKRRIGVHIILDPEGLRPRYGQLNDRSAGL